MQVMERFLLPAARCAVVVLGLLLGGRATLAQQFAAPGKVLISDIIISGNQRMSVEQIKARLHTQVGREYNPTVVEDDVRELYKTHQFSNIKTFLQEDGLGKAKIYFTMHEMPNLVQKITFLGAKHIKEEELRRSRRHQSGHAAQPQSQSQRLPEYPRQVRRDGTVVLVLQTD